MFGVFIDEGIVCDGFRTADDARAWAHANLDADEGASISECCDDHPDHGRDDCEPCLIGDGES
jgi:hypothetical protein